MKNCFLLNMNELIKIIEYTINYIIYYKNKIETKQQQQQQKKKSNK